MHPLDRELWDAARQGDASSFGILFDRHARAIYNFCFRRCGNWAVAEDLTSVVFLEAWRRRSIYLENESALPWLYGIAVNVTRSQRRSLSRYQAALSRLPAPDDVPDQADDVVGRGDDADRMRDVLAAIQQLPQREQDVIALVAWEGLSYEGAAAALGIPVGTVRSRLSRGRRRLQELIDRSGHNISRDIELNLREEHI
jgi:RNA polymerase sigma-70 factor (ECF subfamily)